MRIISVYGSTASVRAPAMTAWLHRGGAALLRVVSECHSKINKTENLSAADGAQLVEGQLPAVLLLPLFDLLSEMRGVLRGDLLAIRLHQRGRLLSALCGEELCFQFV